MAAPLTRASLSTVRRSLLAAMLLLLGLPLPLTVVVRSTLPDWTLGTISPRLIENADEPVRPPLRPVTWWRGEFQRGFEPWFASVVVPRGWIVRLTNQLYYSLFARSYMLGGTIIVGRGQSLYQLSYLQSYCESAHRAQAEALTPFIGKLGELQRLLARAGRPLVFMVTPSKPVAMPEHLPAGLCDRPVAPDRPRRVLVTLLRQAGIPVIDGPELVLAMKASDPWPPFPRGSTHWSRRVGLRVATVLMEEIARLSGTDLGRVTLRDPQSTEPPIGSDADLAVLLNLLQPPLDYPTGTAQVDCRSTARGQRTTLIAVGGSFLSTVLDPVGTCRLFESVEHYFYYTQGRFRWPGGHEPVDRATLRWRETLERAAATVVEINEAAIGPSAPHLDQFLDDAIAALRQPS